MKSFKQFILESDKPQKPTDEEWLKKSPGYYTIYGEYVGKHGFPDNLDKSKGYIVVNSMRNRSNKTVYFFTRFNHFHRLDGPAVFSKSNKRFVISSDINNTEFIIDAPKLLDTTDEKKFWQHPLVVAYSHFDKLSDEDKEIGINLLDI